MRLSEISKKIKGTLVGRDEEIADFQTDSRKCGKNSLFFALNGTKHDGHEFVEEVYDKGAFAVVEKEISFLPYIKVKDTLQALTTLAFSKISKSFRVAVTGSCGKTTTKDIIAALLQAHGSVIKTLGNFNTDVGIALSILNQAEAKYVVMEMGARFKGDIIHLASVFKPHVSVITCVGSAHSKFIDPPLEKSSIALKTGRFVVFNEENIKELLQGKGRMARRYVDEVEYTGLKTVFKINGSSYTFKGIWGRGQIKDLELSISLMEEMGLNYNLKVLQDFEFPEGRMNVEKLKEFTIIDDTYNSNPESLENSADVAWNLARRNVIWILAPMEEVVQSKALKKVEKMKEKYKPTKIFTVKSGFYSFGEAFSMKKLRTSLKEGSVILLKGSRVYQLEKIVEKIKNGVG